VVVTNPTHYAVALRYDGSKTAPEVVAKGKDLIAAQIRRIAARTRVPVVSDRRSRGPCTAHRDRPGHP